MIAALNDGRIDVGPLDSYYHDLLRAAAPELADTYAASLPVEVRHTLACAPVDLNDPLAHNLFIDWLEAIAAGGRVAFPTMIDLISRVCVLGSLMGQARARPDADLYLRMPIEKYRLLDFDFIDEIAEIGYQTARSGLQPMQEWRRKTAAP